MVRYSEWLNDSWKMFSSQLLGWVEISLIILAFYFFAVELLVAPISLLIGIFHSVYRGAAQLYFFPPQLMVMCAIVGVTLLLLLPSLIAGAYVAAFNQMRTGRLAVGDLWKGLQFFKQTTSYVCVVSVLICVGFILFALPGMYLGACAFFAFPLMVDRRLGFREAFNASREVVLQDFWNFLMFAILTTLISAMGCLFVILVFVTTPFFIIMHAVAYRDTFGLEESGDAARNS